MRHRNRKPAIALLSAVAVCALAFRGSAWLQEQSSEDTFAYDPEVSTRTATRLGGAESYDPTILVRDDHVLTLWLEYRPGRGDLLRVVRRQDGEVVSQGILSAGGCLLPLNCPPPGASLSWLVEDQTADGSNAGVIMYTVDETPANNNWWDLTRTDPNVGSGSLLVHTMGSYPTVFVTQANGIPPNTIVTTDYAEDVGILFHGVFGPGNTPLPGSAQISSYDVLSFSGVDPGRLRSLWTPVHSIAYNDAAILGDTVPVPCSGDVNTVLAIGLTLDGSIQSEYVGPASVPIACSPNLADPDLVPQMNRPAVQRNGASGRN